MPEQKYRPAVVAERSRRIRESLWNFMSPHEDVDLDGLVGWILGKDMALEDEAERHAETKRSLERATLALRRYEIEFDAKIREIEDRLDGRRS